ncbi:hypothetical protein K440DRAFT_255027 [Wilcoxina mikolae CBS 423.85]|nr:hypothetical protein K440DRAFT_255027 [Wilcoxina mikolae CBS 423.85]
MSKTELTEQLTICPYGNLKLTLKTSAINTTYVVSSHQLCCASPVFRASLGPSSGFADAINLRHAAATCVSDDSLYQMVIGEGLDFERTAVAVVLYVIHGRAEHIPTNISYENLLDIAIICDYYDCAAAMTPWDKVWMKPLEKLALEPGYEDLLFIAYLFEHQELFGKMTKAFARDGVTVEDGEFAVMAGGEVRKMHNHLPEGIIRDMVTQRAKAGKEILRVCHTIYDIYDDNSTVKCKHGQKYCDNYVFASLLMDLTKHGLLVQEDKRSDDLDIHSNRTLYSLIEDFNNMAMGDVTWNSILGTNRRPRDIASVNTFPGPPHDIYLEVCPFGDVEIRFIPLDSYSGTTFRVSSHVLHTASPVFRDLLGPTSGFAEHTRRHNIQDTPPDLENHTVRPYRHVFNTAVYDPKAFAVVFYALHAMGRKIPRDVDYSCFYSVAVICEDYKCAPIVLAWCRDWIDKWTWTIEKPGYEGWLYIAWVFGLNDTFCTVARRLAKGAFRKGRDRSVILEHEGGYKEFELGEHIHQGIIDQISAQESTTRGKLAEACQSLYKRYCNLDADQCRYFFTQTPAGKICDRSIFADLYRRFKAMNLLKGNDIEIPTDIPLTAMVRDITKMLSDMESSIYCTRIDNRFHSDCYGYVEGTNQMVRKIFDGMAPLNLAMCGRKKSRNCRISWGVSLDGEEG